MAKIRFGRARAWRKWRVPEQSATWRTLNVSATWNGELLILQVEEPVEYRAVEWRVAVREMQRSGARTSYRIIRLSDEGVTTTVIKSQEIGLSIAQPLSKGRFLVAGLRVASLEQTNAFLVDQDGTIERGLWLGDCIQYIQTTLEDHSWVAYGDEGIYGGDPLAAAGVAVFTLDGSCIYRYSDVAEYIDDGYWINVVETNDVWLSHFTDHSVEHLSRGEIVGAWKGIDTPPFAVHDNRILFPRKDSCLEILHLDSDYRDIFTPIDDCDNPLAGYAAYERGPRLLLVTEKWVYSVDIRDLPL